jgi:hypothetical protein
MEIEKYGRELSSLENDFDSRSKPQTSEMKEFKEHCTFTPKILESST